MGATWAVFHIAGNLPSLIERLKRIARGGARIPAQCFNSLLWIRSGPTALFVSRFERILKTSLFVIVSGVISSLMCGMSGIASSSESMVDWSIK